jgi:hypothetical protein
VKIYLEEASLTDVLNAICKSAPRYQWRERDGSLEVWPLEGGSPLLDTSINNFRVENVNGTEAINQLMALPEIKASMRAISLDPLDPGDTSSQGKGEKFSISLERVTMRQALDRVAKESGARFWIFRRDSNRFFSISTSP